MVLNLDGLDSSALYFAQWKGKSAALECSAQPVSIFEFFSQSELEFAPWGLSDVGLLATICVTMLRFASLALCALPDSNGTVL